MQNKVNIFCAGCAVADTVFYLPPGAGLPGGDGKFFAASKRRTLGGMAAAAAASIVALGGRAALWAPAGADADGKFLRAELLRAGVLPKLVIRGCGTAASAVCIGGGGERMIINFAPPGLYAPPENVPNLRGFSAVLADVRWPGGAAAALAAGRAAGVAAVLDWDAADLKKTTAQKLLQAASYIVFSRQGLRGVAGGDSSFRPAAALIAVQKKTKAKVAMTDGKNGVLFLRGGKAARIAAPAVRVDNTLGAGDVFHGALALALAKGEDWEGALTFAAAAAAAKCAKAAGEFPRLAEVRRLLRTAGAAK